MSLVIIFLLVFNGALVAQTRTSVQSGNWTTASTWDCTCVPGTTEDAVIAAGHSVTLTAATTINNFTINAGGIFDYDGNTLTVNGTVTPFVSVQSGQYTTSSTWLNGSAPGASDRVIIVTGHSVSTPSSGMPDVLDITIDAGAVLSTANNKDVTVTSNLVVNGTLVLNSGNANLIFSTASTTVSGSGTIDASASTNGVLVQAATTISSGSSLTFLGNIDLDVGITLTNNGNMIVSGGDIVGGSATAQLTMGTDSDLEIDGVLLSTGILDASTNSGNNVEYNGSAAQTIKSPSANSYHSLTVSGTSTKTFPANALTLEGDLTVTAGTLDVNSQNITIEGNWSNSGTVSNLSTVTFSNTSDQSVTTNATDFVNLTVNKSSGTITLNEDVIVTGTLTLTQGNISTGSNFLQLGSGSEGTFAYTAGRIIGTFGRYIGSVTTTAFDYPIGTSSDDRTVAITFDQTAGGRSAGVVFANFVESDPGGNGFPIADDVILYNAFNEGYWDFTVNGFSKGGPNSFDIVLAGDGFSSFTIGANTRIVTRANAGSNWTADGSHNAVSGNDVSRNNITTFVAQFAFADDTNCTGPSDPTISGVTEVCTSDTNDTYSVTLNSGNDYEWTVIGGTIDGQTNPTGFVTDLNSIDIDWGSTGQVGSVSVQERNTCTTSNTITQSVNINSIAPASITGNTIVPENETGVPYSVTNDANTTYTWTITGGTQASGTTTNSITVDWGSNGVGTVAVTATKTSPSCSSSTQTQLSVTKYIVVNSDVNAAGCNGNWNDDDCWETGAQPLATESARIVAGETINMSSNESITNLIVSGTLTANSPRSLDVGGDLTINSTGTVSGTGTITLSGSLSSPQNQIDGTGTFSVSNVDITTASKTIASTTVMTISGTVNIANDLTLTNNGTVTFSGTLDGGNTGSEFATGTNSSTTFSSATAPMATGTLDASATGSTVVYSNGTGVTIKAPVSSYYNLETSTGTQTLGATTDVNGSFTLTSGTFAMGVNDMTVAGDMTYTAGTLTSTGTITLDGTDNQTVSGAWTIPNLTVNNTLDGADAITVSSGITISTLLTLTDGIMGSGSNVVTVSNTGTGAIAGGSADSFINGILARQTITNTLYDFHVGESTSYRRVGITPISTSGSTYQVEPFNNAFSDLTNLGVGINNVSEAIYWDIQRTAGTDAAQVRLHWNTQAELAITQAADLRVAHYTGGQWEDRGNGANSGDVDPGYVESATATSTFSPFTIGSASGAENPLPVELLSFAGEIKDGVVILNWSTATELNNDFFEIERSHDGVSFSKIGQVDGNGTTQTVTDYVFEDRVPFTGISFYRLKQVDFDGVFEYSFVISVNNETILGLDVLLAPNPTTTDNIQFRLITDDQIPVDVGIYDLAGKVLYEAKHSLNQSEALIRLQESIQLKSGIYLLKVVQGEYERVLRLRIQQ